MDQTQKTIHSDSQRFSKPRLPRRELEHGKLPPQAIDLEETVLGGLMLESGTLPFVINQLSPDVFYKEAHQIIYEAILSLYDDNRKIDILTVANELRNKGTLELSGGPFYITQLTSRIASTANIEYHAGILLQKYLARELIRVSGEINSKAFMDTEDAFELLDHADASISKISEISVRGGSMCHITDAVEKAIEEAKRRELMVKEGKSTGVNSGLKEVNQLTGGWKNSDLIILAARPGMGKTALMLHFAKEAAISGTPVCIYSLEMSDISLANRMILSSCNVDSYRFKKGFMTSEDWAEVNIARQMLSRLPIYIDPNPIVSMRYIRSKSRIMQRKGKCGMIMVDYLQLADMSTGEKNRNREQEVSQASRQAKIIAKELDVPFMLLSQLSRKTEDRKEKEPQLADLRESGAIEQDADLVAFIYRPEYYGIKEDAAGNSLIGVGKMIFAKHRDGSCEDVKFRYNESMTKIFNYEIETQKYDFPDNYDFPDKPGF